MKDPSLDWLSTYLSVGSILILFFVHIKKNLDSVLSSIIAIGVLVTFYKVGHHQFYITLILLLAWWVSIDYKKMKDAGMDLLPVFSLIGWIAFASFLYLLTDAYVGTNWRELLGLPTFILLVWLLSTQIKYSLKINGEPTPTAT